MTFEQQCERLNAASQEIDVLLKASDDEKRPLNDADRDGIDALEAEIRGLKTQIDQHKADLELRKRQDARRTMLTSEGPGRVTAPVQPVDVSAALASPQVVADAWEQDPNRGFATPREFLLSVFETARDGRIEDSRLNMLAAGSDEQSTFADPYGGFLLPKGFSPNLLSVAAEVDPIAGRATAIPMETAVVDIPARTDKNHTNSVSGGLRVYRRAEGDTSSSSRMEIEQVTLRAHSLFGVAYATEELLARSPISFIALLEAGFKDEFGSKLVDERLNGSGTGMMEGIMNTPCRVDIAKETGQAATSLTYENVVNMRARCWRYGQAIWLANHDTLPQLMVMVLPIGTAGVNMWQPSAREGEPDLLLGRPIFFTEYCKTLGTSGDLVLGNWSQYLEGTLETLKQDESIHVRFLNHERTFKFWLENDGRCWWRAALTPKNSTKTLSPFVTVATRS